MQSNQAVKSLPFEFRQRLLNACAKNTTQVRYLSNNKQLAPNDIEISPDGNQWVNLYDFIQTTDWDNVLVEHEYTVITNEEPPPESKSDTANKLFLESERNKFYLKKIKDELIYTAVDTQGNRIVRVIKKNELLAAVKVRLQNVKILLLHEKKEEILKNVAANYSSGNLTPLLPYIMMIAIQKNDTFQGADISYSEQLAVANYVTGNWGEQYRDVKALFYKNKPYFFSGVDDNHQLKAALKILVNAQSAYNKARIKHEKKLKAEAKEMAEGKTRPESKTLTGIEVYRNIKIDDFDAELLHISDNNNSSDQRDRAFTLVQASSATSTTRNPRAQVFQNRKIQLVIAAGNEAIPLARIITDPGLREYIKDQSKEEESYGGLKPTFALFTKEIKVGAGREKTIIPLVYIPPPVKAIVKHKQQRFRKRQKEKQLQAYAHHSLFPDKNTMHAQSPESVKLLAGTHALSEETPISGTLFSQVKKGLDEEIKRLFDKYYASESKRLMNDSTVVRASEREIKAWADFQKDPKQYPISKEYILKRRLRALYELKNAIKQDCTHHALINQLEKAQKEMLSTGDWFGKITLGGVGWNLSWFAVTAKNRLQDLIKIAKNEQKVKAKQQKMLKHGS